MRAQRLWFISKWRGPSPAREPGSHDRTAEPAGGRGQARGPLHDGLPLRPHGPSARHPGRLALVRRPADLPRVGDGSSGGRAPARGDATVDAAGCGTPARGQARRRGRAGSVGDRRGAPGLGVQPRRDPAGRTGPGHALGGGGVGGRRLHGGRRAPRLGRGDEGGGPARGSLHQTGPPAAQASSWGPLRTSCTGSPPPWRRTCCVGTATT